MEKFLSALLYLWIATIAYQPIYAKSLDKESEQIKHKINHEVIKSEKEVGNKDSTALTGNFSIASNYIFRGISQSNNIPAFQGGLTYTFKKTGIYFNIWGSNVYMPIPDSSETATLEIDTVVGASNSLTDHLSYDLHFVRYNYPKANNFEYNELIGSLTYRFLIGLIGYSNNVFNSHRSGTYYNLSANFDLSTRYVYFNDVSLNGAIGYYSLPKIAGKSYKDYAISLTKDIENYTLLLQWTNTNHKLLNNSLDHTQWVAMLTAEF